MMKPPQKIKRNAGRPAAFSREEALKSAIKAFWRHGYDGIDVEQIAISLGATKPSLYRQFGSKKQLFVEALKHYASITATVPRDVLAQAPTIRESLADLLEYAFSVFTQTDEPHGCFLACVATAMAQDHPEAGEIFLHSTSVLEASIVHRLTRAVNEGELPKSFPVKKRAALLVNLLNAYSLRARAGTSRKSLMTDAEDILNFVLN
tara:strand:+ start:94 stop:711 length:618 start_codon:yes stop_codon:yes gene_type:complete